MPNFYANAVAHPTTGKLMEYRQLVSDLAPRDAWQLSAANEFGQLVQGVGGCIQGTNKLSPLFHIMTCHQTTRLHTSDLSALRDLKNKKKTRLA
jgi:hypothetical protein